jgi:hypothetical protein
MTPAKEPGMKVVSLRRLAAVAMVVLGTQALAPAAGANHSWNGYHWARTSNPFTLTLRNDLSAAWKPYLVTTAADWSKSAVLDMTIAAGTAGDKRCAPVTGLVKVCNATYGSTAWLGLGSVWVTGSHITKGSVKMNDSYFNTRAYNTTAWRNLVMCQEVGHTIGLDHQDENVNNANLGTCMDYTNAPGTNQHPNKHDYDELETIYSHSDTTTTVGATKLAASGSSIDESDDLGTAVRHAPNGRPIVFERDYKGAKKFTFVTWAE